MNTAVSIIGLIATLALLGVTYWYARTTKDMADIARQAAQDSAKATAAAERSANAARDAATVAQSQIKPEFEGRYIVLGNRDGSEHMPCLKIDSKGDAVVIQVVRIRRAFRKSYDTSPHEESSVASLELIAAGPDTRLPQRVHYGEHVLVTHPCFEEHSEDPFCRFILDVEYTFSETGGAGAVRELVVDAK